MLSGSESGSESLGQGPDDLSVLVPLPKMDWGNLFYSHLQLMPPVPPSVAASAPTPWQRMALQLLWSQRANLQRLRLIYQCIPHQPPPLRHQQSRVPRGESGNHERIALPLPWKLMALQLLWSPRAKLLFLPLIYQ